MRPTAPSRGTSAEGNLHEARVAWNILADTSRRTDWPTARVAYNRAVSLAFEDLRRSDSDWNEAAVENGSTWRIAPPLACDPYQLGELFPAARVPMGRLGKRTTTEGIGLPVVSWIAEGVPLYQTYDRPPPSGVTTLATALLRFDSGPRPTWELVHLLHTETVSMNGINHPLAMDSSAAHALYWRMSELDKHALGEVLRPDRRNFATCLFFAQAPHPDRVPLIVVHGLNSSPDAFAPMLNELLADHPEFYHLLSNSCTVNTVRHAWDTAGLERRFDIRFLLNGLIDQVLYSEGLVDTTLPFAELRARSRINDEAAAAGDAGDFPRLIREGLPTISK